jgi:hypothetical protein
LNVQQVTSSIVFSSGSNIFGNDLGNTQQFTGSVSVTGSLAVAGAGANSGIRVGSTDGGRAFIRQSVGGDAEIGAITSGGLLLYANNTLGLSFASAAATFASNVGVGVTPSALFHLRGGSTEDVSGAVIRMDLSGLNPYWEIQARNGFNSANRKLGFFTSATSSDVLTLTQAGNVGIDTDTPNALLDVNGDALINDLTVGRGGGNISTNTALGLDALDANTSGAFNTAVGKDALLSNTTGGNNTAIGLNALDGNTTGSSNTAIGLNALLSNTTASDNTAVGYQALQDNTTGESNVAVGTSALRDNTTGLDNTAVGPAAGLQLTTGSNNTLLGHNAGRGASPSGSITTGSNIVVLGNNNVTDLYCADTTISSSDARDKTDVSDFTYGLDWVTQLRPVTYRWDKRSWYVDKDATTEDVLNAQPDGSKKRSKLHIGFLAQEELEVEKQFGFGESKDDMLIANLNEDESAYGIKYERLVPVLVNAIKELKAEIDILKSK